MSAVEKIERQIERLSSKDFATLAAWIIRRRNDEWDQQLEQDSAEGRLDYLFEEVETERTAAKLRDWPPR